MSYFLGITAENADSKKNCSAYFKVLATCPTSHALPRLGVRPLELIRFEKVSLRSGESA
jgi:hypothetical protein